LGFIGGKPNRAFYFIGFDQEQNLVYLDPHLTQESINTCISNSKQIESYFVKNIYRIKINHIQPSLTIGFIFRNVMEFNGLINYLEINNSFKEKFFGYSFKDDNKERININKNENKDDDF
jgi:cysteine protease ATG4